MKTVLSAKLEAARVRSGLLGSDKSYGCYGLFHVMGPCGAALTIIGSAGEPDIPWEHVSVSIKHRPPNWQEMCWVKDQFWNDDECVMQLHPPKVDYVNNHPNCLHLWRPRDGNLPRPPAVLVGFKDSSPTA